MYKVVIYSSKREILFAMLSTEEALIKNYFSNSSRNMKDYVREVMDEGFVQCINLIV